VPVYVTDTHPLIWYATGKEGKLSANALRAFKAATREEALIYVPPFVLWEIAVLLKIDRIALNEDFGDWAEHLIAQARDLIWPSSWSRLQPKPIPIRSPTLSIV
jgi:PIN domain nuclease of toxin-antitoxin system